MIELKDIESRLADYQMRTDRINREAWKWQAPEPTEKPRIRRISIGITAIRQHAGMAIVHAGYRLIPANSHPETRS